MSDPPTASRPGASASDAAEAAPRRRTRWVLYAFLAALVVAGAVRAALPLALERAVAWGSRHYLGLPGRLDNADLALLQGRLVLEGLSLGARPDGVAPRDAALGPPPVDQQGALLRVGRVAVRLTWRDLWKRRLHLAELVVEAPAARLAREADGRVEPLRHARPVAVAEPPDPAEPPDASAPWTLALDRFALRLPTLQLVDEASGRRLFELSLEDLSLDRVELAGGEIALGGLGIMGPRVRVRRELLAARPPAPGTEPPPTTAPAPATAPAPKGGAPEPGPPAASGAGTGEARAAPGYRIAKVDVERATVSWVTDDGPLDVAVTLRAQDVRAQPGQRFPLELLLELEDGRVRAAGDVGLLPPAFAGTLEWSGIPIPRLLLASVPQFAPWLRQADSSGELSLDADLGKAPPATRASGRLSFDSLDASDPKGQEVTLGWRKLEVLLREVVAPIPQAGKPLGTTHASLERVTLVEPKLRYTRPSPQLDALLGIDLSGAGAPAAAPGDAPTAADAVAPAPEPSAAARGPDGAPARGPLELEIERLELQKGQVEALDRTVAPPARTRVRGLSLRARDVRWPPAAVADVKLGAALPGEARLDVAGALRPDSVGDFRLSLQRLELPVFNPYAGAAAGLTVERGAASVDATVALRGPRTEIDNRIVLHRLAVSLRDPESFERTFGVPLDLALALLRDPQGDIALRVPVAIGEQGAEIGLGSVLASALRAALLGALSSPLKLAGAAFGGADAERGAAVEALASVPGSSALPEDAVERLGGLAELLRERPSIALVLRGRAGPTDQPVLAEALLVERVVRGEDLPAVEGAGFLARRRVADGFEHRGRGEPVALEPDDQALYERYVAATTVPGERLDALARARAEGVRAALAERAVPPQQVVVGEPEAPGDPGVVLALEAASAPAGTPAQGSPAADPATPASPTADTP